MSTLVKKDYQSGYRKWMLIVSILVLNIMDQCGGVISALIPEMAKSFQGYSIVQVELSTTIVSVFVTFFVLVSGFITNQIGQKQTAILGLIICAVSSIVPAFSDSYWVVIVSRAIMGIGIGLTNPLAISLIGEFFEGDTRANLMGWRSAIAGLGQSLMTFGVGYLLKINWHVAYLVYLMFIPALLLFIFFVPSPEKINTNRGNNIAANETEEVEVAGALWVVIGLALTLFLYFSMFMISFMKVGELYLENHIGTLTQASTALSLLTISQLVSGVIFGPIYKFLHEKTFYLGLIGTAAGMIVMGQTSSNMVVFAMFILMGVVGGLSIPYIFNKVADVTTTKHAPLYNGIVLVGSNFGSFVAPFVGGILGKGSAALAVTNAGYGILVLTVIVVLVISSNKRHHQSHLV